MVCIPLCASILFVLPAGNHTNAIRAFVSYTRVRNHNSKCAPPAGHHRVVLSISAPVNKNHCAFYPSAITIALVRSSLCIPPTGNPPLQSVRVCPASASATTVHCVFHLPQSELVLSISIPVNENHFCSPHNRQPDRNQWLVDSMVCIPLCASILFVLPAGNHTNAISACVSFVLRPYQKPQFKVCSTCRPSPSCAFSFCTSEQESLCIPPICHHHRSQCLCVPICAIHPPAIHRYNQCVCVQHPRQQPQFTVHSTCHNQNLCFLFLHQRTKIVFAVHTIANLIAISACGFHGVHSIMCFHSVRSACWQPHQCNQCLCALRLHQKSQSKVCSTCWPSPSCAFSFCTSEQESLCIPPISHHHRSQCWCIPVCAIHPPAIHRCNQCVCVQHPRQHPQFTVCQNLCFLVLHQ